jgi:hypothetical protein
MNLQKKQFQDTRWQQWFAGLVDGDGCLLLSPKGYGRLEITLGIYDLYALEQIKLRLGGSIKLRSKAKAYRYHLHHKTGMLNALVLLNGHIRNTVGLNQLKKLCAHYDVPFVQPYKLSLDDAWFSGFFDAAGTISFCFKKGWPQLVLSVSNKKSIDCTFFQRQFGGRIRLDSRYNTHKWELFKKADILSFYDYLKLYPLKGWKHKRVRLIPTFFQLRSLRAYKYDAFELERNRWELMEKQWLNLSSKS